MALWTDIPHAMEVAYPERIWPGIPQEVTVTIYDNTPLSRVEVTLWKEGDFYERGLTNSSGVANFTIDPSFEGAIYLVCYKPNYYPFRATMAVDDDCGDAVAGDANGNGYCNGIDAVYLVNYLRGGTPPPDSCQCPIPDFLYLSADANGNCEANGIDVNYLNNHFRGWGPAPTFCAECPIGRTIDNKRPVRIQSGAEAENESE